MFKKSLLAAALLVAGGTAASAAEIGVRNTWGTTTRHITAGESTYVRNSHGSYTEDSSGWTFGVNANDFEVTKKSKTRASGEVVDGRFSGGFTHASANGSAFPAWVGEGEEGPVGGVYEISLGLTGGFEGEVTGGFESTETTKDSLYVDGTLRVGGSEYSRHASGGYDEHLEETTHFNGSSTQGFSELNTFSR